MKREKVKKQRRPIPPVLHPTAIAFLIVVGACLYVNTLYDQFVWDDLPLVFDNPFIHSFKHLSSLISTEYFRITGELTWRPLCTLSYFLSYRFWKLEPMGWHITNIALHVACGLMVYAITQRLYGRLGASFAAALIFLTHPLQTEVVNGITFRDDSLCLLFMSLAFACYLIRRGNDAVRGSLAALFTALALLTKESAVALPAIFVAYDYFFERDIPLARRIFRPAIPTLATVAYLVVRFGPMLNPGENMMYPDASAIGTIKLTLSAFASYWKLMFWPARQCALYSMEAHSLPAGWVSGLALFAIFALLCVALIRSRRPIGFGAAWFAITLLPVSNIIPIAAVMAERYLYIPAFGLCVWLGGWLASHILSERNRYVRLTRYVGFPLFFGVAIALSALTIQRNIIWLDDLDFWRDTVGCAQDSPTAYVNYGLANSRLNFTNPAENAFKTAIAVYRDDPPKTDRFAVLPRALMNLGILYAKKGNTDEAQKLFREAILANPAYSMGHINLGVLYWNMRLPDIALRELYMGLRYDPYHVGALQTVAKIEESLGRREKAIEAYERLRMIFPKNKYLRDKLKELRKEP